MDAAAVRELKSVGNPRERSYLLHARAVEVYPFKVRRISADIVRRESVPHQNVGVLHVLVIGFRVFFRPAAVVVLAAAHRYLKFVGDVGIAGYRIAHLRFGRLINLRLMAVVHYVYF